MKKNRLRKGLSFSVPVLLARRQFVAKTTDIKVKVMKLAKSNGSNLETCKSQRISHLRGHGKGGDSFHI